MISDRHIQELLRISKLVSEATIGFLKHIVMAASTLLALIVALAEPQFHNRFLFLAILLLLLCAVLFGSIALYIQVWQFRMLHKDTAAQIIKDARQGVQKSLKVVPSKFQKLFLFCELIAVLSFLASLLLIVLYSYSTFFI